MGEIGTVFQRYEKKYRISREQYGLFREAFRDRMVEDQYGRSTVCNIYYDTPDYELIRRSIEHPAYKEKLRLRSYGIPREEDNVFLELKKKYKGIVYKRRIVLPHREAVRGLALGEIQGMDNQIAREINYFLERTSVKPRVYLAYDRLAFQGAQQPDLRVTFDFCIRGREDRLALTQGDEGTPILGDEEVIMEVKVRDAYPLWLVHILEELRIYPTTFSKYGTYFTETILERGKEKSHVS